MAGVRGSVNIVIDALLLRCVREECAGTDWQKMGARVREEVYHGVCGSRLQKT